ncbi:hypothetical protein C5167_001243 [Papaver somniferum]|uniref:Uncharacterized protein n=1 Tax=Papaver somniferum TaxID=3469 RepID=A0A4Y7KXB1_PAPSO|nr:hypothetical protein C5167_001243 [Papaver somniferum]
MKRKKEKAKSIKPGYVHYPYRNISVYVQMSKMTVEFPHIDKEEIDLKRFEKMLYARLGLEKKK